jgi:prevent-host-death family protein
MRTVNIGTLKNQLSAYLRYVKEGEEVIVRDRNVVVARIVPALKPDDLDETGYLISSGQMRPAKKPMNWEAFWKLPAGKVAHDIAVDAATWAKSDR